MLAPYWSQVDDVTSFSNGPSKVFYHMFSESEPGSNTTLREATADVIKLISRPLPTKFNASWVLVVTWVNLRPKGYDADSQNLVRCTLYLHF